MAIGADGMGLDKVQVPPPVSWTPRIQGAKFKFLAAEALRGEGDILLNSDGQRFSDELGHRELVSGKCGKRRRRASGPIRLVFNSKASKVLNFLTRHFSGRSLMKKMTGAELVARNRLRRSSSQEDLRRVQPRRRRQEEGPLEQALLPRTCPSSPTTSSTSLSWSPSSTSPWVVSRSTSTPGPQQRAKSPSTASAPAVNSPAASQRRPFSAVPPPRMCRLGHIAGDSAFRHLFQKLPPNGSSPASQRLGQISLRIDPGTPGKVSVRVGRSPPPAETCPLSRPGLPPLTAAKAPASKLDPANFEGPRDRVHHGGSRQAQLEGGPLGRGQGHHPRSHSGWVDEHPGGANALYNFMVASLPKLAISHDDEVIPKYAARTAIDRVNVNPPAWSCRGSIELFPPLCLFSLTTALLR
ncbi:hypothetical protein N7530_010707 [Penicillium desertorum]|uniref:FAD-dependent oxidoreductase 2 FAD-binding domain-containing protein n=1 Tax=Penicillium desertorum TaxID=1303715 RepID=A0A9X0BI33_9EURO|nr:hypothetical protein N7530_010707 [Penicillium desertorum]